VSGADLELRSVSAYYGRRSGNPVVADISVHVPPGGLVAILGPNGAGKSTLLRCVTGTGAVLRRDGAVMIDGVPIEEYDRPVVPGHAALAFPMRVTELVALGRVPHEHPLLGPRAADRAAIDHAIERVGIGHLRDRDVRELSLGERQLSVLAMTVAQGARLIVLDEPTVHLDLRHQVEVMELLRSLSDADGVTVLAVMHDIGLAAHFFPRVLLLHDGRLAADGPRETVLTPDRIANVYGVDPRLVPVF